MGGVIGGLRPVASIIEPPIESIEAMPPPVDAVSKEGIMGVVSKEGIMGVAPVAKLDEIASKLAPP